MVLKVVASSNGKHDKTHVVASSTDPRGYMEVDVVEDAWEVAQKLADEIPPYLKDDELTAERFYQRNKDNMTLQEARVLLDKLVEQGTFEKQERRRKGQGGSHAVVYVKVEKGK